MEAAATLATMTTKDFFNLKWCTSNDGSRNSKGFTKSSGIKKNSKRKVSFTEKPFVPWNKAKS